jgi:hypothetical protein
MASSDQPAGKCMAYLNCCVRDAMHALHAHVSAAAALPMLLCWVPCHVFCC